MFGNCVEAKAGIYVADYKKFLGLMEGFSGTVRQNTIKEVLDKVVGEDEYSDEFSNRKYAPLEEFEARLFRNELREEQRAKLKGISNG